MDGTVEANTATETTPAPAPEAPQEQTQETTQEQPSTKPAGFDPVDFKTASPEEIEARVGRLYGNVKRTEKENRELKQAVEILTQQLGSVVDGQNKIVQHIQQDDYQTTEAQLRQQKRDAWQKGDLEAYETATEKLLDVKAKKYAETRQQSAQKPQENNGLQSNRAISATEALEMSVAAGETKPEEAPILRAYFGETDENGNLKRPWVNVSDIRNTQAARVSSVVFDPEHPTFGNWNLKQKLAEVDRQMGVRSSMQTGSNVLPAGNLTRGAKTNTVKLTALEDQIAVRTKFGGSKAKTDEDHREAYRQAKIKHSSKGSR